MTVRKNRTSFGSRRVIGRVYETLRRPDFLTDLFQIIKSVVAGTGAWWGAVALLDSPMPFLAPWSALLTVHATVHRSFSRGVQTTVASTVGVGLSFLVGFYLDVSLWSFALALFVGLAVSRFSWIRDEGVAVATTAIFVLSSGFDDQAPLLSERILEVSIGVAAGIAVNLLVLPPLRDRQAGRYVDSVNRRMGGLLISVSDEIIDSWSTERVDEWFAETERISRELNSAWTIVRFARESRHINPRIRFSAWIKRRHELGQTASPAQEASFEQILERLDEAVSHLRHLVRTLCEASYAEGGWDERFRRRWVSILVEAGRAISDPDIEVKPLHQHLTSLSAEMAKDKAMPESFWPTYGSLITSLRHIVVVVDDVGSAHAARKVAT